MDVTAELLETFEFRKKGRGYDAEQVDELIARVRSTLGELETRLADATARAEAAEARAADAEAHARTSSESDETIQRTLLLAQRTADAAVQEAEDAAARKVAEAEAEAGRLVEEADEARARALATAEEEVRRSVDDSRTRLTQEIGALEQIRNTLMADVDHLEEHIDVERGRLRSSSDALTDLLSRSDRLGQVELPELSDIDVTSLPTGAAGPDPTSHEVAPPPEADTEDPPAVIDHRPPAEAASTDDLGWSGGAGEAPVDDLRSRPDANDAPVADPEVIDAPPPPPPPPTFDDDLGADADEPPPPPPPPPGEDDPHGAPAADSAGDGELAADSGIEELGGITDDLDPDDPEENAWLAELTDDDAEAAGASGDAPRRRFGRRR